MIIKITRVIVFLSFILSAFSALATNGYFAHGWGMKAKGMGGVAIALPQETLVTASNPAGMVFLGTRADVGVDLFSPDRSAQIQGVEYDGNGVSNFFIPELGYNHMLSDNKSVGVAIYGNGGMNTSYKDGLALFDRSLNESGINLEQAFIAPTFAIKMNEQHAFGVSVVFARQTFEAKGLANFTNSSQAGDSLTDNGVSTSTGYGIGLGWLGQINEKLRIGASYRSLMSMSKFDEYKGLFAEQGGFDIPSTYGAGFSYSINPKLTIAADVSKIMYSEVAAIANKFENLLAPNPLGSDNGPGFGWVDMTVLKIGASYQKNDTLVLRAGFNHGGQPIPESETLFNVLAPAVVEDHITLGATLTMANGGELSFAYMYALENTVNGSGSIPADFGGGEANITMSQYSLGIAYGWRFQ